MSSVAERLWDRIDPFVAAEGIELDDVEVLGGGQLLRVTVDGPDPIGVDLIADLSRGISRLIDEEDPIKGSFTLEVSSPGLERKLNRPRHYEKSIGQEITGKTHSQIEGSKHHRGG
ncbi:MAG: ribosome maturation factor RimP, partial [Acidimicrobiia bacterium]